MWFYFNTKQCYYIFSSQFELNVKTNSQLDVKVMIQGTINKYVCIQICVSLCH